MDLESKKIRILLIDDDEDDYIILKEKLLELSDQPSYALEWEQTYPNGLRKILTANYDVYLIDYYLGDSSGLDLLQEALQAGCQAPIIMVTGQSNRAIDLAALKAGATDYLVKNQIDGQLLERSIRYALERNRLLVQIRQLAVRDSLTGLYNRRELNRFLEYELLKSRRYFHSFSLLMMDVDHFKVINDRFGHRAGDDILKRVGLVLLNHTRGCDLAARYGGDEFIVVMPETPAAQAWFGAERIRKMVETTTVQVVGQSGQTGTVDVSLSIGIAEYPTNADSVELLIDLADKALYQAKRHGCNQTALYQKPPDDKPGSL